MRNLILVRHSPTTLSGVLYGQSDVPVTHEPNEAANIVLAHLPESDMLELYGVFTSPWERTQPLAECLARELRLPLKIDARLSELNFGDWEGRTYKELESQESEAYYHWLNYWRTVSTPQGETLQELQQRVRQWVEELPQTEAPALVITHASVIRAVLELQANRPLDCWVEPVPHLEAIRVQL